ncbi:HAMP domain-containing sensor histidine kinase [Paenibacillus macerans]|uniref:sensor histidine kinase n=1 Tax=Paenibacillus macerans TaxID=44252 RepID=UPI002DB601A3|nr:HAMP domain-containing sensor histidine kinase [Paenibacillus macerans]MEC0330529.1 HAMP domain-containing sensor histidine kinase [Paenibacillus macerans]
MKFWQKTYLCVLLVFLVAFDLGAYALLQKSYQLNERMDMSRGVSEYESIEQTLSYILRAFANSTGSSGYEAVISGIAQNYDEEGILTEVYDGERLVFSNAYQFAGEREELQLKEGERETVYRKLDGQLWIFVGGSMEFNGLKLVISRSSAYLQDYYNTLLNYFIALSVVISLILSAVLIVLLFRLTAPVRNLNKGVRDIAAGAYHQRVKVSGSDEIAELAQDFNKMVDAVSANIETIQKASEEKENFINNLTHELKTPITAIKGYSEFLNQANSTEEDRRMAVDYIHEHVARLDLLSGKLMELLYLKNEEIALQIVEIAPLFAYAEQMERHDLEAKQIALVKECGAERIYGDSTLLLTLLMNLVENSIKASENGGEIHLKCYSRQQGIVIEVIDYGKGIPDKDIEKITEAFYVVDKSRSKELGGIGLGLSICSQIARLHHARLHIESREQEYTKVSVLFTTSLQLEH